MLIFKILFYICHRPILYMLRVNWPPVAKAVQYSDDSDAATPTYISIMSSHSFSPPPPPQKKIIAQVGQDFTGSRTKQSINHRTRYSNRPWISIFFHLKTEICFQNFLSDDRLVRETPSFYALSTPRISEAIHVDFLVHFIFTLIN